MDVMWYAERNHRIVERFGGTRRDRTIVAVQAGLPTLVTSSFNGREITDVQHEVLPSRLAGPLSGLIDIREMWLDLIPHQTERRRHNILVGLEVLDRFTYSLKGRALACTGTRYVITTVVNWIIGVVRQIANHPSMIEGYQVDGIVEEATFRINDLLRAARCGQSRVA